MGLLGLGLILGWWLLAVVRALATVEEAGGIQAAWLETLTIMTLLQSDLIHQTYHLIEQFGLDFGPETDFDSLTRTVHLSVGVVLVVCCSLRIDFHLVAGLAEK